MNKKIGLVFSVGLFLMGVGMIVWGLRRPITIRVDGKEQVVYTYALMVRQALEVGKISYTAADRVIPAPETQLGWNGSILVEHAAQISIWNDAGGEIKSISSTERLAGNVLAQAGIRLYPRDRLFWNSVEVAPDHTLDFQPPFLLQIQSVVKIMLDQNGQVQEIYSSAGTVEELLAARGIQLAQDDFLSASLDQSLSGLERLTLWHSVPVTIQADGTEIQTSAAGQTVGQALARAGVSLQNLDYSEPAENEPLQPGMTITVHRVREEVILEEKEIPFPYEYVADAETELDQQRVIQAGQAGLEVRRVRVRTVDDRETSRTEEASWTASEAKAQKIGYGTKVVVRTLNTGTGKIEYWRAVEVYATSYSPCNSSPDRCYPNTASGQPVQRGVIAVTRAWYNQMLGQGVYIPGYGTAVVSDLGGGVAGKKWIDLGFSDSDYEIWHQTVTLYFLTPVPENVPYVIP